MLSAQSSTKSPQPPRIDVLRGAVAAEAERRRRKRAWVPGFRGAALEAQSITDHEWILSGPAETGKTWAALWRLDTLLRTTPRSTGALVRKVRADMGGTVLRTYERLAKARGGVVPYGGKTPEWYEYENAAVLYIGGMDRPGKVLSGERDWIVANQLEEFTLDDWETLTTRCTGRGAWTKTPMLFGDCNPSHPSHWILHRPSLKVLHSFHQDNPSLYTAEGELTEQGVRSMAILDALTGVRRERLRFGRWVAAEGVVYDGFERGVHLIPRKKAPPIKRWVGSIDWGFTNPSVFQLWGIDGDGRMYLFRELYRTQRLAQDLAEDIKALLKSEGISLDHERRHFAGIPVKPSSEERVLECIVADHDAEDRATLARSGVPTRAAIKEIGAGIQKVQARLRTAGDGKPRIYVLDDALVERDAELADRRLPTCLLDEFEVYAWPKGKDGKPVKEVPDDVNNHGSDAMRYAVEYVDRSRGPAISLGEQIAAKVAERFPEPPEGAPKPPMDITARHQVFVQAQAEVKKTSTQRPRFLPANLSRMRRLR